MDGEQAAAKPAMVRRPFGRPRFYPGREVEGAMDAFELIMNGSWIYWRDGRPLNPKIAQNMSLATIAGAARYGRLRVALEFNAKAKEPGT